MVNKTMIEQALMQQVYQNTSVPVNKVVKLEEVEQKFRHACSVYGDIIALDVNYFPVYDIGVSPAFYFCQCCGTLYIQKDYM